MTQPQMNASKIARDIDCALCDRRCRKSFNGLCHNCTDDDALVEAGVLVHESPSVMVFENLVYCKTCPAWLRLPGAHFKAIHGIGGRETMQSERLAAHMLPRGARITPSNYLALRAEGGKKRSDFIEFAKEAARTKVGKKPIRRMMAKLEQSQAEKKNLAAMQTPAARGKANEKIRTNALEKYWASHSPVWGILWLTCEVCTRRFARRRKGSRRPGTRICCSLSCAGRCPKPRVGQAVKGAQVA